MRESEPQGTLKGLWVEESGRSESLSVMGRIGVEPGGFDVRGAGRLHHSTRKRADFQTWSLITREIGKPLRGGKQMTAGLVLAGAPTYGAVDWNRINWRQANRIVRRLQARIVKAVGEGRWGKVKALQRLLTRSFSGKALAVRRVTENKGKRTPGVDGEVWDTPKKKAEGIASLRQHGYRAQPLRRRYIPKRNGRKRPLGIPVMLDRAMQALYKLALEPIAETTGDPNSYGFRRKRSQADAIAQCFLCFRQKTSPPAVYEGDIAGCFDNLCQDTLLKILSKRITDQRLLHLIKQFLRAGYVEDWQYNQTYSGTPQGGNLSPILSNVYLHEFDQRMADKIREFNKGKKRQTRREYWRICDRRKRAKKKARKTGDWTTYKALTQEMLRTQASEPQDPNFRRMYYCRYADDFLVGIIGSKKDAEAVRAWLSAYLKIELKLELSAEKTLITHVERRVRFLGYDIKRGDGKRRLRVRKKQGVGVQRTCTQKLVLLMPGDKCEAFAKEYGQRQGWQGRERIHLVHLSELEILMTYNAEIRGFLGYYALADNLTSVASSILWLTTTSFLKTLAAKRRSTLRKVARSLKRGPNRYVIPLKKKDGRVKEYALVATPKQVEWRKVTYEKVDVKPNTWKYRRRTELGQRLQAHQCEWCGREEGPIEVHHVRKLKDLKGKKVWERQMIARRRKTMVLCKACHVDLHAGRLNEATKLRESWRAGRGESRTSGSEGSSVKPGMATC